MSLERELSAFRSLQTLGLFVRILLRLRGRRLHGQRLRGMRDAGRDVADRWAVRLGMRAYRRHQLRVA